MPAHSFKLRSLAGRIAAGHHWGAPPEDIARLRRQLEIARIGETLRDVVHKGLDKDEHRALQACLMDPEQPHDHH